MVALLPGLVRCSGPGKALHLAWVQGVQMLAGAILMGARLAMGWVVEKANLVGLAFAFQPVLALAFALAIANALALALPGTLAPGFTCMAAAAAAAAAPPARTPSATVGAAAVAVAAVVLVLEPLLHHFVHQALGRHAARGAVPGAGVGAEDEEALVAPRVQRHEHVGLRLLLHAPQLAAAVARDPALAVLGDVHLRGVVAARDIGDCDAAAALLQQPGDELFAAAALLQGAGDEADVAYVLQDRACCKLQLLARGALLAQGVAQLVVLEDHAVGVEALALRELLADAPGEGARGLVLHAAHDHELGATTGALAAKDDEHLAGAAAAALL
mmetsp:Transcript_52543/g.162679  ORF Transcript_52543/g.162679 Transcript_52543/m.162679 type:complete len:330 (+) Transcript_52543:947-1936(+)